MVRFCVIRSAGTNCDMETVSAIRLAGGEPELISLYSLRESPELLRNFQVLVFPGGFTYGDDLGAGKVFSLYLMHFLMDALMEFIDRGGLILGICNGFQILVRTGLLPGVDFKQVVSLGCNDSDRFECRWVHLKVDPSSPAVFTRSLPEIIELPVAHMEGKFIADDKVLLDIEQKGLVPLRYCTEEGEPTMDYPYNPNGSMSAIAGICDSTGRIMGLMPHPERFVHIWHHPSWRREEKTPIGLFFFTNAVEYFS